MARALVGISLVVVAIAAAAGSWWMTRQPAPEPPAIEALGSMDPEVAALLRELRAAVETDRGSAEAWGRLAMGCEANGFVGAAREAYQTAARLAGEEPRWAYRLALVTSRLGEPDAALATLTRVNELAPDYGPAWCRRGLWLLDRADTAGAEQAFRRALAIDANDPAASIGLARVHLQKRENNRAAVVLEGVLEQHPGDRYALQLLGTAYRRLGRMDDASFALAVGAAGEPSLHDPWSAEVGDYRRGFATLLKAATAEAMAGRLDRALPILEDLRRRNPDDVSLTNHTAEVLTSAGRAGDAIRMLEPMQSGRGNAETHLALASAYLASGELEQAGTQADRAIGARAPGGRALGLKGLIAWRARRPHEALELFEQALARDPRDVRLLAWSGLIHLEAGNARDAASEFMEVLRRDPMQPDALAGLAMARLALGAREEAALALSRAEQVAPGHPRVREARAMLDRAQRP